MKPDPIEQEDKKIRKISNKLEELWRTFQHAPSVPLEKPIQRGWVRHYVLTREAELHPDVAILREILEKIGTEEYHWRRDFRRGRRAGKGMIEIKQSLRPIPMSDWNREPEKYPDRWKRFFHREFRQGYYSYSWEALQKGHQWVYVFNDSQLFELKVEPHWLTHVKVIDPLAIERKAELHAWMYRHNGWRRYDRLKGRRVEYRYRDRSRIDYKLEKQQQAQLRHFLIFGEEADMRSSLRWFRVSFFFRRPHPFPHVAQCRGTPLRTETVRVQILSWGPLSLP